MDKQNKKEVTSSYEDESEMTNQGKSEYIAEHVLNFGMQNKFLKGLIIINDAYLLNCLIKTNY